MESVNKRSLSVEVKRHSVKSSGSSEKSKHSRSSSKKASASSPSRDRGKASMSASERSAICYPTQPVRATKPCEAKDCVWQNGKYVRDECGSGIVPLKFDFQNNRKIWCQTPLSLYQATHGELGRRILCRYTHVLRDIMPAPPSNMSEYILPFCRGYYRKYPCIRPCEERYVTEVRNKKIYRDSIERYWNPCIDEAEEKRMDILEIVPHHVALARKTRRKHGVDDVPCW